MRYLGHMTRDREPTVSTSRLCELAGIEPDRLAAMIRRGQLPLALERRPGAPRRWNLAEAALVTLTARIADHGSVADAGRRAQEILSLAGDLGSGRMTNAYFVEARSFDGRTDFRLATNAAELARLVGQAGARGWVETRTLDLGAFLAAFGPAFDEAAGNETLAVQAAVAPADEPAELRLAAIAACGRRVEP